MMKRTCSALLVGSALLVSGCDSSGGSALLGGVGGAAAGAGGYEYHLNRQKTRVETELKEGKIDQEEYDIRMDQIRRDSFIQYAPAIRRAGMPRPPDCPMRRRHAPAALDTAPPKPTTTA